MVLDALQDQMLLGENDKADVVAAAKQRACVQVSTAALREGHFDVHYMP